MDLIMEKQKLARLLRDGFHRIGIAVAVLACALLTSPSKSAAEDCRALADKTDCPQPMAAESSRGLALGTGVRATAVSTSALAYSPAGLAMGNLYHIEGNLDYLAEVNTVALGAGVVDSSTSKVGAGVGVRGFLSGDEGFDGLDGRLGLALSLSDAFSLGIAGRYIDLSHDAPNAAGDLRSVEDAQGFTMDASLRVIPTAGFQIDLGALNFIDLDSAYVPTTLTAGFAVGLGSALSLGVDMLTDMSTFKNPTFAVGGGIEYLMGDAIPLRAGYSVDVARKLHAIGAGVGYIDDQISLDMGLHQIVSGGNDTRIMLAVRYHVN